MIRSINSKNFIKLFYMEILKKKKSVLFKIPNLILAIAYGFFIIWLVQIDSNYNSGDINALLKWFREFSNLEFFMNKYDMGFNDYSFRYITIKFHHLFNLSFINLLKIYAFLISSIFFYIYIQKLNQKNNVFYLSILFLMVFFTPRIWDLWASGIRSGIAFLMLFVALVYLKGVSKYIVFIMSALLHLSMVPIIVMHFLFNFSVNNKKYINSYFVLIFYGLFIALFAKVFMNISSVNQSIQYQLLVLALALIFIFINKEAIKDEYWFLSIGTMLIVIFGFMFDVSFIRYVGNSIILYLFFLINKGKLRSIQLTCIFYIPFFSFTLHYSIINLI